MGIGFWVTQVILVLAAIATGVYVERRNRAEKNVPPADAPKFRVSVEGAEARVGAQQFTAAERSRLTVLRRLVEQARELRGELVDDLQPDRSTADEPHRVPLDQFRDWRTPAAWIGLVLVVIGCVGVWQATAAMTRIEHDATGAMITGSLTSHLVPGVIANTGKYLAAVKLGSWWRRGRAGSASGAGLAGPEGSGRPFRSCDRRGNRVSAGGHGWLARFGSGNGKRHR